MFYLEKNAFSKLYFDFINRIKNRYLLLLTDFIFESPDKSKIAILPMKVTYTNICISCFAFLSPKLPMYYTCHLVTYICN